jgi:hypothetical protein
VDGLSSDEIAKRLPITEVTVRNMLRRAGYTLRPRGGQKGHLRCPRIKTAEIVRLKDEGLNYAKIAEKLHTSRALVMYRLTKVAGLTLAPIIDRNLSKKLPWDEIIALYSVQKVSIEKIAKRHKAGTNTILRGLVKRGIEIRSKTAHVPAMWAERKQKLAAADHILAQQTQQQPRPPGRPKDPETDRKLELMAKLAVKEGQSLRAMSTLVFPDKRHTPEAAYASTRKLASDYRADLEAKKLAVAQV